MKRIVLSVLTVVLSVSLFAQLPVDSTVQNKNVILEEFTGIHCGYCPDGHKISNTIMASNPGDVFVINIHTGGYAVPSGNEPDFRTSFGSAIDGQADVAGYPAGTVNRHLFAGMSQASGTAMSRGDWQTASNQILGETSYANMAMDATINLQTRELTVNVQLYFTGSGAPTSVNLNIAVIQDSIPGPQSGASANPSQVLPNGDYNHMHMLRHLITGQWGEIIDTTAQGTLIQRQYTYTIPADINSVPMELNNLNVVGFIAEGQQEIITGAKAGMSLFTPPGVDIADLSVRPDSQMPAWCDYSIDPKVKVINTGSNPVDTFRVGYNLNDSGYVYQKITTTLAPGDSTVITFPTVTLPEGENKLSVNANVDSTSHLLEISIADNTAEMPPIYTFPASPFSTTVWEDFENYAEYDEAIDNALILGEGGAFVLNQYGVNGLDRPIGGYGKSENSFFFFFYNMPAGSSERVVWEKLDFSNNTNARMRFDHAYAQYSAENDMLKIEASTDCGATWTTLFEESGSNLATAPAYNSGNFFPESNQWDTDTVDISSLDGESEVMISATGLSDYGNNLYIDNFVVFDDSNSSIRENDNIEDLTVYPNPARNFVNVDLTLAKTVDVQINVINTMGQVISEKPMGVMTPGKHSLNLNTSDLAAGLYSLQIITGDKVTVERLSVTK
ncbi:MAG: Omp28-related outer membrane protein [Bacteroidales bacterium]|nr:Omp28-related outer membrane protein [Bacteroidales bacterium]